MSSTTTENTVSELPLIFAQHGLPEEVVLDNGPQFTSIEFAVFMTKNGIKHTLVPPYHPQSNGATERSVRVVKEALVKQVLEGNRARPMEHRLADFLQRYRTTPHSTTGATPAELLMKSRLRTRLSLVKPDLAREIEIKQSKQMQYKDLKNHKDRRFSENDIVWVRNIQAKGNILRWIGHKTRYVHADHLIRAHDKGPNEVSEIEISVPELCDQSVPVLDTELVSNDVSQPTNEESEPSPCKESSPVILR